MDLVSADILIEREKHIRSSHVAIELGNFILENQVISKGIPGQVADDTMVLMEVMAIVGKNQVRLAGPLQLLKLFFDFASNIGEKATTKLLDRNSLVLGKPEESTRAFFRLRSAGTFCAEHNPTDRDVGMIRKQFQNRPATSDLNVVRVRSQTEDGERAPPLNVEI